jgi:hypothetical protein
MSTVQTGNLAVPGAGSRNVVVEPGPVLIPDTPAHRGGVALLSRQLARRAMGVAHDARSHVTT